MGSIRRSGREGAWEGRVASSRGVSSRAEDEEWAVTGEVFWNPPPPARVRVRTAPTVTARAAPTATATQYEIHEQHVGGRNWRAVEQENVVLLSRLAEVETELQREKAEKRKMLKNHRDELRYRDRKEMVLLWVVALCVVIDYAL
ncbi:unnamed protein product [Alopecurus aequalis]